MEEVLLGILIGVDDGAEGLRVEVCALVSTPFEL